MPSRKRITGSRHLPLADNKTMKPPSSSPPAPPPPRRGRRRPPTQLAAAPVQEGRPTAPLASTRRPFQVSTPAALLLPEAESTAVVHARVRRISLPGQSLYRIDSPCTCVRAARSLRRRLGLAVPQRQGKSAASCPRRRHVAEQTSAPVRIREDHPRTSAPTRRPKPTNAADMSTTKAQQWQISAMIGIAGMVAASSKPGMKLRRLLMLEHATVFITSPLWTGTVVRFVDAPPATIVFSVRTGRRASTQRHAPALAKMVSRAGERLEPNTDSRKESTASPTAPAHRQQEQPQPADQQPCLHRTTSLRHPSYKKLNWTMKKMGIWAATSASQYRRSGSRAARPQSSRACRSRG